MVRARKAAETPATRNLGGIEQWLVSRLKAYDRNSQTHSEAQVAKIARSIERFGFTSPILVGDDEVIIAGHGRLMGAIALGMKTVPVIVASGWSADERRAFVIADNQIAADAGWDEDMLRLELGELRGADFDLSLTGFDEDQLAGILDVTLGGSDPEEVPPVPATPVSVRGDVWLLGRHRLICGDSTNPDDVAAVLKGAKPHLMVTDPPYGVEYDASWRPEVKSTRANGAKFSGGKHATGKVQNDGRSDWREAWALFPGDVAYIWHADRHASSVQISIEAMGFDIRCQIIWAKPVLVIGRGDYHWQHEPCWYAVRKGKPGKWAGDRKQTTLWQIANMHRTQGNVDDGKTSHSTQKPVECMQRPIENSSKPGDAVYEPFSGSGTTLIAAEMTGRRCYAIELDPSYVDVAALRWSAFAEEPAILESAGETFEQVKAARLKKRKRK